MPLKAKALWPSASGEPKMPSEVLPTATPPPTLWTAARPWTSTQGGVIGGVEHRQAEAVAAADGAVAAGEVVAQRRQRQAAHRDAAQGVADGQVAAGVEPRRGE